jgi:hypothetical protein
LGCAGSSRSPLSSRDKSRLLDGDNGRPHARPKSLSTVGGSGRSGPSRLPPCSRDKSRLHGGSNGRPRLPGSQSTGCSGSLDTNSLDRGRPRSGSSPGGVHAGAVPPGGCSQPPGRLIHSGFTALIGPLTRVTTLRSERASLIYFGPETLVEAALREYHRGSGVTTPGGSKPSPGRLSPAASNGSQSLALGNQCLIGALGNLRAGNLGAFRRSVTGAAGHLRSFIIYGCKRWAARNGGRTSVAVIRGLIGALRSLRAGDLGAFRRSLTGVAGRLRSLVVLAIGGCKWWARRILLICHYLMLCSQYGSGNRRCVARRWVLRGVPVQQIAMGMLVASLY